MLMRHTFHHTKFILLLLLLLMVVPAMAQKNGKKPFTVVIDAGHGGVDPGALGKKSQEKNINFNVSNRLGELIKEAYPEVKIIYTRTTDVKIPLARRADIANKANANLFISIHSNASKNRNANGCQTFTLGAGSDAEAKAAAMYENEVILSEDIPFRPFAAFKHKRLDPCTRKNLRRASAARAGTDDNRLHRLTHHRWFSSPGMLRPVTEGPARPSIL